MTEHIQATRVRRLPTVVGVFPTFSDEIPDGKRFAQVHWLKLLTWEGKCFCRRAKPAHMGRHVPLATQGYSSALQNTVLGRSLKQLIETVTLLGERDIELRSLKENIDTTTPTGKFMFHVIGAMAEFERDVIRERTQAGLESARALGRRGGRPKAIQTIEPRNLARAKALYAAKSNTIAEIMQMTGFKSRNTFYKYVVHVDM